MTYEPQRHHCRSIRLRGYDYAQAGAYFVTICVQDRACLLGEVVGGEVSVSRAGQVIEAGWLDLPRRFPGIDIDAFVVMPNHVHGIVVLGTIPEIGIESVTPPWEEGAMNRAPTQEVGRNRASAADHAGQSSAAPEGNASGVGARFIAPSSPTPASRFPTRSTQTPRPGPDLGEVIRAFKAVTARQIRLAAIPSFSWQRNYYERIIRNDRELARARAYVAANPARWSEDVENPIQPR